jgi:hypothetical protein
MYIWLFKNTIMKILLLIKACFKLKMSFSPPLSLVSINLMLSYSVLQKENKFLKVTLENIHIIYNVFFFSIYLYLGQGEGHIHTCCLSLNPISKASQTAKTFLRLYFYLFYYFHQIFSEFHLVDFARNFDRDINYE